MLEWKSNLYRVGTTVCELDVAPAETSSHRKAIEPWLSAVFQSEHLSLLIGSGFSNAIAIAAGASISGMAPTQFGCAFEGEVNAYASATAKKTGRGEPNFEDQIRAAVELATGFKIIGDERVESWESAINAALSGFLKAILNTERGIAEAVDAGTEAGVEAKRLLTSFLLSFGSRTAARERLHVFTTNYDRIIEYGCDLIGFRAIDRFVGALSPIFRSSRLDIDLHYNPPGIRGEPRFLEGVIKLSKLHGSIEWRAEGGNIRRALLPFGAIENHPDLPADPLASVIVYPNPAKDVETAQFPYAELFRDFSAAICRPNSALVTYGYGFGDDHINRVIMDALSIPSTHLVIISFDDAAGRVPTFCRRAARDAQISLLVGDHFGELRALVDNYLPKPAIDQITIKKTELLKRRVAHAPETPAGTD